MIFKMLRIKQCNRVFSGMFREYSKSAAEQQVAMKQMQELQDLSVANEWNFAKPFDTIPGPKPGLILGYFRHFIPKIGKYDGMALDQIHISMNKEYGDIVRIRGLKIRKDLVCIYDPKDIETIFRNEGPLPITIRGEILGSVGHYRKIRSDLFRGYSGIFTSEGEEWQKSRSMLNPIMMHASILAHYIPHMDDIANDFIKRMRNLAASDPNSEMPGNFQNELTKWAGESVGVIALDCRIGMLDPNLSPDSEQQHFIDNVVTFFDMLHKIDIQPNLSKFFRTPMWNKHIINLDKICRYVDKQLKVTKARIEKENNRDKHVHDMSLLERLLRMDSDMIFPNAIDIILGGMETTSRTMSNVLYHMAIHEEIQEKLREEVMRVLPTPETPVTKEHLDAMPYLRAVIKESMRLAPIIISVMRRSTKDLVLSGYQIPKGTDLMVEQIPLAWNEKYFTEAQQYKPERWMRSAGSRGLEHNPWVFLPFGFGLRACIGRRLAMMELEILLAKVIRNFKLEWHHDAVIYENKLVYGIASPLKIRLKELEN